MILSMNTPLQFNCYPNALKTVAINSTKVAYDGTTRCFGTRLPALAWPSGLSESDVLHLARGKEEGTQAACDNGSRFNVRACQLTTANLQREHAELEVSRGRRLRSRHKSGCSTTPHTRMSAVLQD